MKLISVSEAAGILSASDQTVRNLCTSGELKFIRLSGSTGHRRVVESSVFDFIQRQIESTGDQPEQLSPPADCMDDSSAALRAVMLEVTDAAGRG